MLSGLVAGYHHHHQHCWLSLLSFLFPMFFLNSIDLLGVITYNCVFNVMLDLTLCNLSFICKNSSSHLRPQVLDMVPRGVESVGINNWQHTVSPFGKHNCHMQRKVRWCIGALCRFPCEHCVLPENLTKIIVKP